MANDGGTLRDALRGLLEQHGLTLERFAASEEFLHRDRAGAEACLLVDACLPGMSGLDLMKRLAAGGDALPAIMITGSSDVPMAAAGSCTCCITKAATRNNRFVSRSTLTVSLRGAAWRRSNDGKKRSPGFIQRGRPKDGENAHARR